MKTVAVVLQRPEHLALSVLDIAPPGAEDVAVAVEFSGISSGTERLLWSGRMPDFPGMGYPLVPGYESVGHVIAAGSKSGFVIGDQVFVPGANCFGEIKGLFGGAASKLVTSAKRVVPLKADLGQNGILLALAATAYHAIAGKNARAPELIIGHGIVGRLLARITVALGMPAPAVWETNADRRTGADGYSVIDPLEDTRHDYGSIYDASGAPDLLDKLIKRLARNGEITLAGFYEAPLSFAFPPAFMREARIRVVAEWQRSDIVAVTGMIETGLLKLDGLITHTEDASTAPAAYRTAFGDAQCLKMVLDWRAHA